VTTPKRTAFEIAAILLVAASGIVLGVQQSRVNAELDELNERSRENQVLRCYELGLAGRPLDPTASGICVEAFADQEGKP
jgi:hypothetical protein